jgi:tetratricopeptide (TPR) repeat protein
MDRLIWETEYDFEGTEIMRRQKPRVLTPVDSGMRFGQDAFGRPAEIPQFLKDIMIEQTRLQPVKVKLDSVIIKGSKILKQHPKSDYVEGTLLLMAKSFFYQSEWVSGEIKCVELIDRFALGDMSPDAHLLLSKIYLIQRKYALGKTMLSRTADIAWYKKRYDILSEAFRLMAEQAIFDNDEEEAVRPYRQAIAQSDDGEIRARWQLDLASLYYRLGKFDRALKEFNAVLDESPELVQEFEAELYKAACLMYLKKHEEAQAILDDLDGNENFKEYKPDILAQRLRMLRILGKKEEFDKILSYQESLVIIKENIKKEKNKKTKKYRYLLNDIIFADIVHQLNERMTSNIVNRLVQKGLIETAFDDESNDFVFWAADNPPPSGL